MHTNMQMYHPSMPSNQDAMGYPQQSNFSISYGMPNAEPQSYDSPRYGMQRDRNQGFIPKKNHYGMKNSSYPQKDSHYHGGKSMSNGRNPRGDNFGKYQNPRFRQNDSYRDRGNGNEYDEEKILPQSKKIFKPMGRDMGRKSDSHRPNQYGDQPSMHMNRNFSKNFPRRQEAEPDIDKGANSAMFFKTKMCPQYKEGSCPRGVNCSYAHSEEELRQLPNLKKTKLCQLYQIGKCNKGNMCSFAHGEQELRSTPEFFKTSICNGYLKGYCRAGENCRYAHGKEELRLHPNENYPSYMPSGMPMYPAAHYNLVGYNINYQAMPPANLDMSKDPNNDWFILNGNNLHSYMNHPMSMDPNPVDPNYLNINQGTNGSKPDTNDRNEILSQNMYTTNNKPKTPVQNNRDKNSSSSKSGSSQGEHADSNTFQAYNPEKTNPLFTPNENANFLK